MALKTFSFLEISITLPDGSTHKTPLVPSIFHLENSLFSEIRNMPQPPREFIVNTNQRIFTDFNIEDTKVKDFSQELIDALHPAHTTSSILTTIIVLSILVIFLLITCKWLPSMYNAPLQFLQNKLYNRGLPPATDRQIDPDQTTLSNNSQTPLTRTHRRYNLDLAEQGEEADLNEAQLFNSQDTSTSFLDHSEFRSPSILHPMRQNSTNSPILKHYKPGEGVNFYMSVPKGAN